jgi:hypothetical protein
VWKEVTEKYVGMFFRAEGGTSAAFGQIQGIKGIILEFITQKTL